MTELLHLDRISFCYQPNNLVLQEVSLSFQAGERVALLGRNGAGKSTFFLCCNGVLEPSQGTIYLKGQAIKTKADYQMLRQAVGLVFQDPDNQLIAGSVSDELSFGLMNMNLPRNEVKRRVDDCLLELDLERYRDQGPHYLSGGEKKRVTIGDVLVMRPEMMLLDEPTASLDPEHTSLLIEQLDQLNQRGMTLIISTHDVNLAYQVAERAIVFADGRVVADGPIGDIFSDKMLLAEAGLEQPLIYQVAELLGLDAGSIRTTNQLKQYIKQTVKEKTWPKSL